MVARAKRLIVVAALLAIVGGLRAFGDPALSNVEGQASTNRTTATRIVSLVPALTEILFAVGAGPQVVGVSNFDVFPPEVKRLPRVGALLDPDTERILAMRPDLVIVYGSQTEQEAQFARAGIRTYGYRHGGIPRILETITDLGGITGHAADAQRVVRDLQTRFDVIRGRVAGRSRPRTVLVLERQRRTLQGLYVSGGYGFLHDMLEIAGGVNVFADIQRESVQPSHEVLLARAPEVIVELAANALSQSDLQEERGVWSQLGSIPAVRRGRVYFLFGQHLVVAGPRLAQGAEVLARTLHPEAF